MGLKGNVGGKPGSPISQKTSGRKIATSMRRQFVLQSRLAGYPFSKIIDKIYEWAKNNNIELPKNYNELQACQDVTRELDKLHTTNQEMVGKILDLELERLDYLQTSLWSEALKGDERKTDRVLKIMERRSKYMGLDAPVKTELEGSLQLTVKDLHLLLNEDSSNDNDSPDPGDETDLEVNNDEVSE